MGWIPDWVRRKLRATSAWAGRQRDDLIRDGLIGFFLAVVGFLAAWWIASRQDQLARDLETASEIQENVRFVRQVVIDNAAERPFAGLKLRGAVLGGLDLGCDRDPKILQPLSSVAGRGTDCAIFYGANLDDADLDGASLRGAILSKASLVGASLILANLELADLRVADLRGADLRGADLSGARLSAVCYDSATKWPDGFTPPPPTCPPPTPKPAR